MKDVLEGNDRIRGSQDADNLIGYSGDDTISGARGEDLLNGRRGADTLRGNRDDDRLRGGAGEDILDGGHGNDVLRGEEDRDVFVFDGNDGSDGVRDFEAGLDLIQIEGADFFGDLDVIEDGDDVLIIFDSTEITLRDIDIDDLGRSDFLFV